MAEINLRKSIPIIGTISSGKSLFLDNLLGLNLLESSSSITSKFVCIIRHNKSLLEPKFYHIELIENGKDQKTGMIEYNAKREGEIITGHENIKETIKKINKEQKDIKDKNIEYKELFYILEINITNIKNEELLNNYDFYDIPGLDEYISDGIDKNEEKKKKMKYIDNLFKYFRSRIDFGVFILNSETAYVNSSQEIIINVANILKPKKIKNYLIILNKIDRKSEPNQAFNEVKAILVNDLLDHINLADNTFISLDSRQIKHQNLLKENFEDFLLFLFNQYVSKSVIPFKDGGYNNIKNKYNTKNYSFSDYLYDFIFEEDMNDSEKEEYLNDLENKFQKDGYNFDELGINYIIEKIKTMENMHIEFNIDFENDESIKLFKALYIIFKEELKFPYSQQVADVYNYFNNILERIKKVNNDEDSILPSYILNQENLIDVNFYDKFDQFIENFESKDERLNDEISSLYNSTFYQQFFYIGIFGISNTGKSSILNNILGYDILPVNQGECTKRGIVIEYGEEIALFKAKSETNFLFGNGNILVFKKIEKIVSGEKEVKEYLNILNSKYANNTNLKNYDYFIVTFPIKFFEEINLDINLRKIIKFIDLPGNNIFNAENNFSYEKIINSTSLFICNFTNSTIGSVDNNFNRKIYAKFKEKNIVCKDALKNILFNVNLFQNNELNENNKKEWNKKIINVINDVYIDEKKEKINLNLTYINSKSCQNYNKSKILFCGDYQALFDDILEIYHFKGKKNCFSDFMLKNIKFDLIDLFDINSQEINKIISEGKYNNDIHDKINNLFKINSNIIKGENNLEKNIQSISSCLSYAKNNIQKAKYFKNSYIDTFFKDLTTAIFSTNEFKSNYSQDIFNSCVKRFDNFFQYDEEYRILNFTKNFDSFFSLFQSYKKADFFSSSNILALKKTVDDRNDYYKLKKQVRGYGSGPTQGSSDEYDWSNGITNESDYPKVYSKFYERKCDGKPFQKMRLYLDEKFDDIIVGWKISSRWRDGTNGEWNMEGNPLLTNKIKIEFVSQSFRGERFDIYVYLMKYPE